MMASGSLLRGSRPQMPLHGAAGVTSLSAFPSTSIRCSDSASQPHEVRRTKATEFWKKDKQELLLPCRLTSSGTDKVGKSVAAPPQTVYTLRIETRNTRKAGLDNPYSGVLVCMVGMDGTAILRRVSPINDPEDAQQEVWNICSVADKDTGANCSNLKPVANSRRSGVKSRFQPGSVEEVCFLGPELGPLASVMIGPECGTWQASEITIVSSRTHHTDRFVCRDCLGTNAVSAAFLSPVPPDSVIMGSGEAATILTKEQATALHRLWMMDYGELKDRLMLATSGLVIAGAGIAFTVGGWDVAAPFLAGGVGGIFYCWLLQRTVDAIPAPNQYSPALREWADSQTGDALQRMVGSSAFRFAVLTAMALGSVWAVQLSAPDNTELGQMLEVRQVLTGILGFLMWKIALVGVTTVPVTSEGEAAPSEKKSPF